MKDIKDEKLPQLKPFTIIGVDKYNRAAKGRSAAIVTDESEVHPIERRHIVNASIPEQGWREVLQNVADIQKRGGKAKVTIKINADDPD
jgi:hypothetical protein